MLDVAERTKLTDAPLLDRASKRAAIEAELLGRPDDSNRAIARDVGCDDKTVAKIRSELEAAGEIPQRADKPEPNALSDADRDGLQHMHTTYTEAAAALHRAANEIQDVNLLRAARQLGEKARDTGAKLAGEPSADEDEFDWSKDPEVVFREQRGTAIYSNKFGEIVIRQHLYPDEDAFIYVGPAHLAAFIARLQEWQRHIAEQAAA